MKPYHFSLLRYVHHAAAGEFVNIGVAMWLPDRRQLLFALSERTDRASTFFADLDAAGYSQIVRDLRERLNRLAERPNLSEGLDALLRQVIPSDSACLAHSDLMGGTTPAPKDRLRELFHEFVLRHERDGSVCAP